MSGHLTMIRTPLMIREYFFGSNLNEADSDDDTVHLEQIHGGNLM